MNPTEKEKEVMVLVLVSGDNFVINLMARPRGRRLNTCFQSPRWRLWYSSSSLAVEWPREGRWGQSDRLIKSIMEPWSETLTSSYHLYSLPLECEGTEISHFSPAAFHWPGQIQIVAETNTGENDLKWDTWTECMGKRKTFLEGWNDSTLKSVM